MTTSLPQSESAKPHLSVVIPIYNRKGYLLELVQRFGQLPQAILGSEVDFIYVDDGSDREIFDERDLPDVLKGCSRIFRLSHFGRPSRAKNYGAAEAGGASHLLFMDSDDLIDPQGFVNVWNKVKRSGADVFPSNFRFVDSESRPLKIYGRYVMYRWFDFRPYIWTLLGYQTPMLKLNQISANSVVKRQTFLGLGGFNENVSVEDYEFWLRAVYAGCKIKFLGHVVYQYRVHSKSRSYDKTKEIRDVLDFLLDPKLQKVMGDAAEKMKRIWQKKLNDVKLNES